MTEAADLPLPGVDRQRAVAWLMEQRPNISEISADRALDLAVTDPHVVIDRYFLTWDPDTRFTIWPGNWPLAVLPAGGHVAETMRAATRRAQRRADQTAEARGGAGSPAARAALTAAAAGVVDRAFGAQQELSYDQAAWLSVTLADTPALNHAWARMDPARRTAYQALWSKVTRLARPRYVAAPACLLTLAALQSGSGHIARCALHRALADQPGCPHAALLVTAMNARRPAVRYDPALLPPPAGVFGRGRPALPDPEIEP